jgi:predicted nucleic acid-binding protein
VTVVVDASVVVALLLDGEADGAFADQQLSGQRLVAPHLLPAEVTNVIRRAAAAKAVSADAAALAIADLGAMSIDLFPFAPFAARVWELRKNLTSYDAWYVGLAESLDVPLVTLDKRLARANGPRCEFLAPGRRL